MIVDAPPPRPAAASLVTAFAGAGATCCGIGLSRFAYVPLFPAMVAAGWVSGAEAGLLGALNLAGYLVGVLGGRPLARAVGTPWALDLGMALAILAFAGCGFDAGLVVLATCRFLSGAAGGTLMALAGPAVQGAVGADRKATAGGIVFAGVGSGIVVSTLVVPAALPFGVGATWFGLAAASFLIWLLARPHWPRTVVVVPERGSRYGATLLHVAYGASAAGLVPHMVYFADLAVRGRGVPEPAAFALWTLFGIGGLAGTLAGGRAVRRFGAIASLRIWLAVQAAAVALALLPFPVALVPSAFLGGFSAIGLAAVALARAAELAGPAAGAIWVRSTASFAVAQAMTGFALAWLFARTHSHLEVFGAGFLLSMAAFLVSCADRAGPRPAA